MKATPSCLAVILTFIALPLCAAENPFIPPNFPLPKFQTNTFNVKDFGATGSGETNDTPAIDAAIEKCNSVGGGTVYFSDGKYSAASIHIKSNVRLLLSSNAVIFGGSRENFDAPEPNSKWGEYQDAGHRHFHNSLMWGENITNFAIEGGKVNGGSIGHNENNGGGDKLVSVVMGKNLLFKDVTHDKGGHFVYLLNDCENITLDHVVIKESRDAVDFMGCRNVQVHDCNFTGCADDTIGVKSDYALGRKINSANFYVWDNYFESGCNGLQFGSETAGDFHNVNFWNIRIGRAMKAGIGITCNDGGVIDGVNYSNIVVKGAACPIYVLIMDRLRSGDPDKKIGAIRNVHIQDVTITDCMSGRQGDVMTAVISGLPESRVENFTLENVKINYPGGETNSADADIVPQYMHGASSYSPKNFGTRPASAFYIRHVKGLTLKNVGFTFDKPDVRPPVEVYDADGLTLDNFKSQKSASGETMRLEQVKNFTVQNSLELKDRKSVTVEKGGLSGNDK